MKQFVAVFCLLLCAASLQAKDKPNPADFPIKIHISATQIAPPYMISGASFPILVAETVLNGKNVKLAGDIPMPAHGVHLLRPFVILPGDYQIQLKNDRSEKDSGTLDQEYELLLPNGVIWKCTVIGISE